MMLPKEGFGIPPFHVVIIEKAVALHKEARPQSFFDDHGFILWVQYGHHGLFVAFL